MRRATIPPKTMALLFWGHRICTYPSHGPRHAKCGVYRLLGGKLTSVVPGKPDVTTFWVCGADPFLGPEEAQCDMIRDGGCQVPWYGHSKPKSTKVVLLGAKRTPHRGIGDSLQVSWCQPPNLCPGRSNGRVDTSLGATPHVMAPAGQN